MMRSVVLHHLNREWSCKSFWFGALNDDCYSMLIEWIDRKKSLYVPVLKTDFFSQQMLLFPFV